jgi:predicted phosphodiesterase
MADSVTAYISDIHGNTSYAGAVTTVMNYLNDTYKTQNDIVVAGDFVTERKRGTDAEMIADKTLQAKEIDSEFGKLKGGKVYGIVGNHDYQGITKDLTKVQFIEYKSARIGGKNHYGVNHFNGNHGDLESKFEDVKKGVLDSDIVVAHEGPHEEFSYEGTHHHKGLSDLIKNSKKSFVCGHVHAPYSKRFDKGSYGLRSSAENDAGAAYFRVMKGDKEVIYKIANSQILKWANEVDKKGNYTMPKYSPEKEQQEHFSREYSRYVRQKYPDHMKDFLSLQKNKDPALQKKFDANHAKYVAEFEKLYIEAMRNQQPQEEELDQAA